MKRRVVAVILAVTVLLAATPVLSGCSQKSKTTSKTAGQLTKVSIANYGGAVCFAPLYVAKEKGFFKKEGLDAELVNTDFTGTQDGLASGKIDAALGLFHKWIKPINEGLDIKFTAGLHTGCIQVVAGNKSGVNSVADLKGKRIGVDAIGAGPMNLLAVALNKEGIDWQKDVTWKAYPPDQQETALKKGEIDVVAITDPFGQSIIDNKEGHLILSLAETKPYSDSYCCFVAVSGKLIKDDPKTAAALTKALMEAAQWVDGHRAETAKLEIDKKYCNGTVAGNTKLLEQYKYEPSVTRAKTGLVQGVKDLKAAGILNISQTPEAFADKIFASVTDDL
jgi:NitT/TauT family transport system substrate-binding protein